MLRNASAVSGSPIPLETSQEKRPASSAMLGLMMSVPCLIETRFSIHRRCDTSTPLWNHRWVTFEGKAFASQINSTRPPSSLVTLRGGRVITAGPAMMILVVVLMEPSRFRPEHRNSPMSLS